MDKKYIIPAQTRIGHVHLKVSDIKRSLEFYCDLLGFELTSMYGNQAVLDYITPQLYILQEKTLQ